MTDWNMAVDLLDGDIVERITCFYCNANGLRRDICSGGWRLAKNKPFRYVCTNCRHLEKPQP